MEKTHYTKKDEIKNILKKDVTARVFLQLKEAGFTLQDLEALEFDLKQIALPDRSITQDEMMTKYGYTWNGMLPVRGEYAWQISELFNVDIYQLYDDNTEGCVLDYYDFCDRGGTHNLYGIQVDDWEKKLGIDLGIEVKEWEPDLEETMEK